jgi:arabinogalactan oligomer/maltooligosaccharide transport system permease protein
MTLADITPRRVVGGLLAALLLGGAGIWVLAGRGAAANDRAEAERLAIVTLHAATAVVESALSPEAGRAALKTFAQGHATLHAVRVVDLGERTLAASTAGADAGDNAAPRKLVRDEKPLFDQAQRIKTAVANNRDEHAARAEEIEIARVEHGHLELAGPWLRAGEVVCLVKIEVSPSEPGPRPAFPWLPLLLPILALAPLAWVLRRSPAILLGSAALLLIGGLLWTAREASADLALRAQRTDDSVAAAATGEAQRAGQALSGPALDAAAWDTDVFRHTHPAGTAASVSGLGRIALGIGLVAVALLAWIGIGGAVRFWNILVANRVAYAYTLPAMLGMLVLVFFPFIYGIGLSFTNANIYNSNKPITEIWSGLENFKEILGDFHVVKRTDQGLVFNYGNFYWTLFFTIVWTISNVTIGVSFGLILALILNTKGLALRAAYRVLLILPWAMPNYITALIWKGMFHRQFGVVNQILQIVHISPVSWFEGPLTSFATVLTTNGWLSFPFMMVVSLGALQSIPADLYEAARVDGAGRWQQFRSITLPSLKPALVPAVILSVIWTFNQFNIIYLVSQGEPAGSTEILITQAYKLAFEQYRYGYAAAYSTVIFLILLMYGSWQNRVTRATEGVA